MIELSEEVKQKLSDAVMLWAADNLLGRPRILAHVMCLSLENRWLEEWGKIDKNYPVEDL